jgi:glycosyltransferase involved in cell wall biosynthesis
LYIGRLIYAKGIDLLIRQFQQIKKEYKNDWRMVIAGNGPLDKIIPNSTDIQYVGFKSKEDLIGLMSSSGLFCLPSRWEPWGVVVHESVAAGLPVILSDACGSAEIFLEEGENGFSFRSGDELDLKNKLLKIMALSDETLYNMGKRSLAISQKITPEKSADTLMRVVS